MSKGFKISPIAAFLIAAFCLLGLAIPFCTFFWQQFLLNHPYDDPIEDGYRYYHRLYRPRDGKVVAFLSSDLDLTTRRLAGMPAIGPKSEGLSKTQADFLFEQLVANRLYKAKEPGVLTYGLCSSIENSKKGRVDVFIDTVFKDGKLDKYRIRGHRYNNPKWKQF